MPLSECKIPTLIVSPPAVVLVFVAGDEAVVGLSAVVVGELFVQAFRRKLVPIAAEPYTKNLRRLNRIAICDGAFVSESAECYGDLPVVKM